jgi:hypothetical protein
LVVVSWLFVALLAAAVAALIGAEWPRIGARSHIEVPFSREARRRRARARRKKQLRVVGSDSEEFIASVHETLANLPTIEEHDPKR